jgi:hypothetical protein
MENTLLKAVLSNSRITLVEHISEQDRIWPPCLIETTYEPITIRRPDPEFQLLDECELHGLRFVITERRPVYEWAYTLRVFRQAP